MEHDYAAVMAHNPTSMLVHTFTSCRMDNFKNVSFSPTASILVSVQQRSNACLPHQGIRRAQLCHGKDNATKLSPLQFYLWKSSIAEAIWATEPQTNRRYSERP